MSPPLAEQPAERPVSAGVLSGASFNAVAMPALQMLLAGIPFPYHCFDDQKTVMMKRPGGLRARLHAA